MQRRRPLRTRPHSTRTVDERRASLDRRGVALAHLTWITAGTGWLFSFNVRFQSQKAGGGDSGSALGNVFGPRRNVSVYRFHHSTMPPSSSSTAIAVVVTTTQCPNRPSASRSWSADA